MAFPLYAVIRGLIPMAIATHMQILLLKEPFGVGQSIAFVPNGGGELCVGEER